MTAGSTARCYDLLAIGDPVLDVWVRAGGLPRWDDKRLGQGSAILAGGSEANAACAASRLGLRTALVGRLGDGPEADFLCDELRRFGVGTEALQREPDLASALAVVFVSDRGERAITYVPMAAAEPRWSTLEALLPLSRSVYLLPYDMPVFARLAQRARQAGTQVVVDVERAVAAQPNALATLCAGADVLCFNEAGFQRATGHAADSASAAALLAQSHAHTLVVSLGPRGALAVDRAGSASHGAYACEVVDTTGAGDCFNAGFVSARLQGHGLAAALSKACAAAALCIECVGPRDGLPDPLQLAQAQQRPVGAPP